MNGRFDYVKYDVTAQEKSAVFKKKCQELEELAKNLLKPPREGYSCGRAIENALNALEETFMWLGKAIRDEQVQQRTAELQEERCNS